MGRKRRVMSLTLLSTPLTVNVSGSGEMVDEHCTTDP
jgi:hypothetical protein